MVKNPPAKAEDVRDVSSIPGLERSPREGKDNPIQHSCLENLMDRGAWWDTVYGAINIWIQLKQLNTVA